MPRPAALLALTLPSFRRQAIAGSSRAGLLADRAGAPLRFTTASSAARSSRSLHSSGLVFRAPVPSHPAAPSRMVASSSTASLGSNGLTSGAGGTAALGAGAHAPAKKKSSGHLIWYREIVPAMLPILLLSTTIFLLLSLSRTHLSAERSLAESQSQITALEAQLAALRKEAKRRVEKERRERERMLPLVVEKVLTKVGAMRAEVELVEADAQADAGRRMLV